MLIKHFVSRDQTILADSRKICISEIQMKSKTIESRKQKTSSVERLVVRLTPSTFVAEIIDTLTYVNLV